ncbi:hypothetical protein [Aedoeadaptatus coxii]|uniref:hypothetical protein n=1 Tax=Aedoeadaptatus coxii TaxID=755172 RepID=UPI002AD234D0|nr:hypothetical protein [Peptoniphilus coxii]
MPKKLVLDRAIAITLTDDKSVTVPNDEVWRLSVFGDAKVNDVSVEGDVAATLLNGIFSSGTAIKATGRSTGSLKRTHFSGIAFKLQEV